MFTEDVVKLLSGKLDPKFVKSRKGPNGKSVEYMSGDDIVTWANELFGFGNWDKQIISITNTFANDPDRLGAKYIPPSDEYPKGVVKSHFTAIVRITVRSRDRQHISVHEEVGDCESMERTVGAAIGNASKGAVTDAMKRAFVDFGNTFGNALRDKTKKNVGKNDPAQRQIAHQPLPAIDQGFDGEPAPREERMPISARASAGIRPPQHINGRAERAPAAIPY